MGQADLAAISQELINLESNTPQQSGGVRSGTVSPNPSRESSRRSAGRGVAELAHSLEEKAKSEPHLAERRSLTCTVITGLTKSGAQTVMLSVPREGLVDRLFDVSFLQGLPNLFEPLLEAIKRRLTELADRSRGPFVSNTRLGFCKFAKEYDPKRGLDQVDREMLVAFVKWVDTPSAAVRKVGALSVNSSRRYVGVARSLFEALRADVAWGRSAERIADHFPTNTHPGSLESAVHREILPWSVLTQIFRASVQEIGETSRRLDEGERLITEGNKLLGEGNRDYSSLSVALAKMVARYPGVFPIGRDLIESDPRLGLAIYGTFGAAPARRGHGINAIARYRYANPRTIVPFVLALTIEAAFNPESVLNLKLSDISEREVLGVRLITIDAPKGRGLGGRYKKDIDPGVVGPWLEILTRVTRCLRSSLPEADRDKLFIFSPKSTGQGGHARGFTDDNVINASSNDMCWKTSLERFQITHGLPRFTLSQIRATMLDQVGQQHGSLIAQQAGQHQHFQTTDGHYLGPGTRQREQERLGETIQQMERWIYSTGKVDVRLSSRSSTSDKGAATPGFLCADPHDSPIPGQPKHKLCRAYGMCATCPLGFVDENSFEAIAHWIALERAVHKARDSVTPQQWLEKWGPVAVSLAELIKRVPDYLLEKAQSLRVELPAVG